MCRLFAYVHSGSPASMRETLGGPVLDEFRQLAEVHRDGWGAVWMRTNAQASYLSPLPASDDGLAFDTLTTRPLDAVVVHERWASPGIGLSLDNQQPFWLGGIAFAHNGTIGNKVGNIIHQPTAYREALGLIHSHTTSDSRIYADLFFLHLDGLRHRRHPRGVSPSVDEVHQALVLTIAQLRRDYPHASFNNVIQTPDFTLATRAHADKPVYSAGLRRGYEEAGWSHRIDSYYELAYTTISHANGSVTSVASSSGYAASDSWTKLANNTLLAISHRDASVQTLPLDGNEAG